jgi:uncharacterized damage-inducible protein DinB
MLANELILDAFERIKQVTHRAVEGLNDDSLMFRPTPDANSIAWLVWHLARIQDDHISGMAGGEQVWHEWAPQFNLPFDEDATGYAHSSEEVGQVRASAELLLGYYDAVHDATIAYLKTLAETDYGEVVDRDWNPPVTRAVRLVSVIADDLQHAGQASYVRGLLP